MLEQTSQPTLTRTRRLRAPALWLALAAAAALLWLVSGLPVPALFGGLSTQLQGTVTIFLGIFIEALPFLLAGVLASSAIHLFVSDEQVQRLTPRNPVLAAFAGALLGMVFPVCECGSVPTARRLMAKGAPVPLGMAFMLAAPVINPIVIVSTWVAFGNRLEIVIGRVLLTIVIAVATSLALGLHPSPRELLAHPDLETDQHDHVDQHGTSCGHTHPHEHGPSCQYGQAKGEGRLRQLFGHASSEFFEMGRYLVIGALIAAALQTVIPRAALLSLGQGPIVSALALMGLAVVLSICSTVDAFVALAFASSFLPGALLAFLVFGPMVDIKSVLMFGTTFRRRTVALMVLLPAQMTLLAAVIINMYW